MDTPRSEAAALRERPPETVAQQLASAFGADRALVAIGENFRLSDEHARAAAFPQNLEELSEMLKFAARERLSVIPAGAGTWLEMGNRPVRAHLILSTSRLNRVVEYEPADLTATLEAGVTLDSFNAAAAEHRQFIPLDPFGDGRATIGAVIATASAGPLRAAYGTPRDWVIGMRVVHPDGRVTKAGGKVVKNVAGYDLCKLYAGSFGTLGVIAELSFKLRALPPEERTLVFYASGAATLCELAAKVAASDVQPSAMELLSAKSGASRVEIADSGDGDYALALRFFDEAETVAWQTAEAVKVGAGYKHTMLSPAEAAGFWQAYRDSETSPEWDFILRLSALPADLGAVMNDVASVFPESPRLMLRAHAANGVVRLHASMETLEWFKPRQRPKRVAELRQKAQARGGQMVLLRAPDELKAHLDVWGEVGETAPLMRALKEKFDPQSLLNPGRFVAGI
jgi:glycolate oxidase FAD binding subunit